MQAIKEKRYTSRGNDNFYHDHPLYRCQADEGYEEVHKEAAAGSSIKNGSENLTSILKSFKFSKNYSFSHY